MTLFFVFVFGWFSGLIFRFLFPDFISIPFWVLMPVPFVLACLMLILKKNKPAVLIGLTMTVFSGAFLGYAQSEIREPYLPELKSNKIQSKGRIASIRNWGKNRKLVVKIHSCQTNGVVLPIRQKILLTAYTDERILELKPGQLICFEADLYDIPTSRGIGVFNESAYWRGYGVRFQANLNTKRLLVLPDDQTSKIMAAVSEAGNKIRNRIESMNIDPEIQAVLLAMLTGDKGALSPEQKDLFSNLGIMHLLAVSGLHMGLVYWILNSIFRMLFFQSGHTLNRFLSTAGVWAYALVCGLPPSAVRAATMLSLYTILRQVNRSVSGIHVVVVVSFLHSFISPASVFSSGFQLSYLAVAGIILYFPKIRSAFKSRRFLIKKIVDLAALSLSAQMLTWPLSITLFARFPVWFLLSNIVMVPIGIILFYAGLLLSACSFLFAVPLIVESVFGLLMKWWISAGGIISSLPFGVLHFSHLPKGIILFYTLLLLLLRPGWQRVLHRPYPVLILIILWSLYGFFNNFVPNLPT